MNLNIKALRRVRPHLEQVGSVELQGAGQFVIHRDHAFVGARYGGKNCLSIVNLSEPEAPKLVETMRFKRPIASVAVRDDTLFAAEDDRAVNFIRVSEPARPDYFDCGVTLGKDLYQVHLLGDYAVLAMNWDGVGLMDVKELSRARFLEHVKLDQGFIERLVVVDGRIFCAGASGGLRVFEIQDGHLVETASHRDKDLNASQVFAVGGRVWAVVSDEEDDENRVIVIDPGRPGEVESSFQPEDCPSSVLLPLEDGGAVGLSGYTCRLFTSQEAWGADLFTQFTRDDDGSYMEMPFRDPSAAEEGEEGEEEEQEWVATSCMDDIRCAQRFGDFLVATYGSRLYVFRIPTGSVFAGVGRPSE